MKSILWAIVAWIVSRGPIAGYIINRARRTPYTHITGRQDQSVYMLRWWLFNPYGRDPSGEKMPPRWKRLPSIRVHEILRPDDDAHEHDHPWRAARTIVLRGWYGEQRNTLAPGVEFFRDRGYTGPLPRGLYHRITTVSSHDDVAAYITGDPASTCTTLFLTWWSDGDLDDDWGFLVGGRKIHHRQYLDSPEAS